MEYDEVCLNYFLEHQSQLFDENVADSLEAVSYTHLTLPTILRV